MFGIYLLFVVCCCIKQFDLCSFIAVAFYDVVIRYAQNRAILIRNIMICIITKDPIVMSLAQANLFGRRALVLSISFFRNIYRHNVFFS
jgi:hypothetical protein